MNNSVDYFRTEDGHSMFLGSSGEYQYLICFWEEISPNCIRNGFKKANIEEYEDFQNYDSF